MNAVGLLAGVALAATAMLPADFPQPESLQDNVWFWEHVYAEWRTDQIVIHDSEHMKVVYRVVDLGELALYPRPETPQARRTAARARRELVEGHLDALEAALDRLAAAAARGALDPEGLSPEDRAVYDALAAGDALGDLAHAKDRLRWQYGLADQFVSGLARYDAWKDLLTPIFEAEGVPEDLVALAFVESLFNPEARSHAGAAGIFQFMPATGRELGLGRTRLWDARRDPVRAAQAAARMLGRSHARLGSWPLALTAYNHGPNGVARAVEAVGSSDLEDLIREYRSRTWGFASKNFYAEFLAARHVLDHREEIFGDWVASPPASRREVRVPAPVSVTRLAEGGCLDAATLRFLNPALLDPVLEGDRPIPRGYPLRVPDALEPAAFTRCATRAAQPIAPASDRLVAVTRDYRVRRGDTLTSIARRHGLTVADLRQVNELGPDGFIYAGQLLRLPGRGSGVPSSVPAPFVFAQPER